MEVFLGKCFRNKIECFKKFFEEYFNGEFKFDYQDNYFWTKRINVERKSIGIPGLNTLINSVFKNNEMLKFYNWINNYEQK